MLSGTYAFIKFIPVLKMAIPLIIMLVAGTGIVALGKTIRDGASAKANLELTTEINDHNTRTGESLHLVAEQLRDEAKRLRADDQLHRQEIDLLKARLADRRGDNLEGLALCPPENCTLDWSQVP